MGGYVSRCKRARDGDGPLEEFQQGIDSSGVGRIVSDMLWTVLTRYCRLL